VSYKNILVPVDFSDYSEKAVDYAIFLAEKFCAEITLIHIVELFEEDVNEKEHLEAYEKIIEKKEAEEAKKLQTQCQIGKDRGLDIIHSVLLRDISAADAIINYAADKGFDVVIMGTHGRKGLTRWLSGSVTEKVVRHSSIPVITVHKDLEIQKIEKILVPVDFSTHSSLAIQQAKRVAAEFNASLNFLHVVEMESHPEFYNISFKSILKENPALNDHILTNLKKLADIPESEAVFSVMEGSVHRKIKQYIELNDIDLIILPTRGINDLEHFFMGSNAEKVVRSAPCPVLTVRN